MNNLIVKVTFGSHLYGLATENSDYDYKGVFLPSKEEVLLGRIPKHQQVSTGIVDYNAWGLHELVRLALSGETNSIDMLHADKPGNMVERDEDLIEIWNFLVENRQKFYSKNMKSYSGYLRSHVHMYNWNGDRLDVIRNVYDRLSFYGDDIKISTITDLPHTADSKWIYDEKRGHFYQLHGKKFQGTLDVKSMKFLVEKMLNQYGKRSKAAERNQGIDWKSVSHALRAGYQLRDIYTKGDFEYPLKEKDFLLKVKLGHLDFYNDVSPELLNLVEDVGELQKHSTLPEKPDHEFWENWLMEVIENYVMRV